MAEPLQIEAYLYYPISYSAYAHRKIRCSSWQYVIGRQHVVSPIPGMRANAGGEPGCFALDFGAMTEDIIIQGGLPDYPTYNTGETDTTTPILRWPEIEEIWRTSWRFYSMTMTANMACLLVFYDDAGSYYEHYVLPGKLHLRRDAAKELWDFTATFYTVGWSWT